MNQTPPNAKIAEEIKSLILNIQATEKELYPAVRRWKSQVNSCEWINEWEGKGLGGTMKSLCENPEPYLKRNVFPGLYTNLLDYRDLLLGSKAYTSQQYQTLMKGLVSGIHRYVVISTFFARNPYYLIPGTGAKQREFQQQFKKAILENNKKLMWCDSNSKFPIQERARAVGMVDYHQKILTYLKDACSLLSMELVKVR